MRRCFLVCYDIRNARRLRRVHRVLKGYGEPWQYSIFFCILKEIDRVRLQTDLETEMNLKEDSALLLDLGPNEVTARESATMLGSAPEQQESGTIVL